VQRRHHGYAACTKQEAKDGIEVQFTVNHLANAMIIKQLLSGLLLPPERESGVSDIGGLHILRERMHLVFLFDKVRTSMNPLSRGGPSIANAALLGRQHGDPL
jgi:hypothetical protein